MEVVRSVQPKEEFLQVIREICTNKGIVLLMNVHLDLGKHLEESIVNTMWNQIYACLAKHSVMVMQSRLLLGNKKS